MADLILYDVEDENPSVSNSERKTILIDYDPDRGGDSNVGQGTTVTPTPTPTPVVTPPVVTPPVVTPPVVTPPVVTPPVVTPPVVTPPVVTPNEKNEAKEKSNTTPAKADENVEQSAAMTDQKSIELSRSNTQPPAGTSVTNYQVANWNFIWQNVSLAGNPWVKKVYGVDRKLGGKYWAYRGVNANPQGSGFPKWELEQWAGPIQFFVPYKFNASETTLYSGATGFTQGPQGVIDVPLFLNFPETGIWNPIVPYVGQENTEQLMMMTMSVYNKGGEFTIGTYGGKHGKNATWADEPWWCGLSTNFYVRAGKYKAFKGTSVTGAAAGNGAGWNHSKKIPFPEGGGFAGVPACIINGKEQLVPGFDKISFAGRSSADAVRARAFYFKTEAQESVITEEKILTKNLKVGKKTKRGQKVEGQIDEDGLSTDPTLLDQYQETTITNPDGTTGPGDPILLDYKIKQTTTLSGPKLPITVYEKYLPDPIVCFFWEEYHYTANGMTKEGLALIRHLLTCGWETAIVSKGGHVEMLIFLNPDGTCVHMGGNTNGGIAANGTDMTVKVTTIWKFGEDGLFGLLKCTPTGQPQKVISQLNGKFRRTPAVNDYYKKITSKNTGKLNSALKSIYDDIVEK